MAEAALAAGVERFVYVSSIAALYCGPDCGRPLLDDSVETDPRPGGREIYSRGKMEAERALLTLHRERGLPLVIARPGVVLGEGTPLQHSGLGLWVRDNHCVGWGQGDHPLPVVGVDDVADALVRLAVHDWQRSRRPGPQPRRQRAAHRPPRSSRSCAGRPAAPSTSSRARSGSPT